MHYPVCFLLHIVYLSILPLRTSGISSDHCDMPLTAPDAPLRQLNTHQQARSAEDAAGSKPPSGAPPGQGAISELHAVNSGARSRLRPLISSPCWKNWWLQPKSQCWCHCCICVYIYIYPSRSHQQISIQFPFCLVSYNFQPQFPAVSVKSPGLSPASAIAAIGGRWNGALRSVRPLALTISKATRSWQLRADSKESSST